MNSTVYREVSAQTPDGAAPSSRSRVPLLRAHPLWLIALLAVALRAYPWSRPHTLFGVMEVDDGVYYGAAKMLLHGFVPYADFTIVHPPVTSLLLLPFAGLGAVFGDPIGMAAARIMMAVVAVLNVVLVHRLALRLPTRAGRQQQAALVAAVLYAVMPNAVIAEHTVLLEPLVNLFCLLAVLCLVRQASTTRASVVAAGVLLAAAVGIKAFAAAYVVGVLIWLVVSRRRDLVAPLISGLILGSAVLLLPFFLLAPGAFWHDIVVTQLSRPADGTPGGLIRMLDEVTLHVVSLAVVAVLLAAVLAVGIAWERRAPKSSMTLWLLVGGLGILAFATSPSYFAHYGAFLVPPLAMVGSRLTAGPSGPRWPKRASTAVLVVLLTGFAVVSVIEDLHWTGQGNLHRAGELVPQDSCVYYEAISLAVAADVLTLPRTDCPAWIDGRGVNLTWSTDWPHSRDFYPAGFLADARWQAETAAQLRHADFLLLNKDPHDIIEWTAATRSYALSHFTPVWIEPHGDVHAELWKRTTPEK